MSLIATPPRLRQEGSARPGEHLQPIEIVVVGAHGGAGTSTLTALLHPAWDLGVIGKQAPGSRLQPGGRPVVLVSRGTVAAAREAMNAAVILAQADARAAVLVVV